ILTSECGGDQDKEEDFRVKTVTLGLQVYGYKPTELNRDTDTSGDGNETLAQSQPALLVPMVSD
ncbi:hypothetical protein chiPu_0026198, partial [Chiloscyllium punctatum]|nr:hypothetical protein [Chiloscyllium punctatum]